MKRLMEILRLLNFCICWVGEIIPGKGTMMTFCVCLSTSEKPIDTSLNCCIVWLAIISSGRRWLVSVMQMAGS